MVRLKRVYEDATETDGQRVLVDRLWPRGVTKERAAIDWWAKELAPSNELRTWFAHDPGRYAEFKRRYREELAGNEALGRLKELAGNGTVTLVYSAKDEQHNQARVLQELLA